MSIKTVKLPLGITLCLLILAGCAVVVSTTPFLWRYSAISTPLVLEVDELDNISAYSIENEALRIIELDSDGNELSNESIIIQALYDDYKMKKLSDGFMVYGTTNNTINIFKLESQGTPEWIFNQTLNLDISVIEADQVKTAFSDTNNQAFIGYISSDSILSISGIQSGLETAHVDIADFDDAELVVMESKGDYLYLWVKRGDTSTNDNLYIFDSNLNLTAQLSNLNVSDITAYSAGLVYVDGQTATAVNELGGILWQVSSSALRVTAGENRIYLSSNGLLETVDLNGLPLWNHTSDLSNRLTVKEIAQDQVVLTGLIYGDCKTNILNNQTCDHYYLHHVLDNSGKLDREVVEDIVKITTGLAIEPPIPFTKITQDGIDSVKDVLILSNGDLVSAGTHSSAEGVISAY